MTLTQRISLSRKTKRKNEKIGGTVKVNRSAAVKYKRVLTAFTKQIELSVVPQLTIALKRLEPEYISDGYVTQLTGILKSATAQWRNISAQATFVAEQFVNEVNTKNKQRFYNAIEQAIGVNLSGIIQDENMQETLDSAVAWNINLIQSIPSQYFTQLDSIIWQGVSRGDDARSMVQKILDLGQSTNKRAKLIARDQTQKLNAAITQQRQENLGIEEYVWRTSEDERVRVTHRENNGKTFRWDKPPPVTGHPGQDINCRCYAAPVINL